MTNKWTVADIPSQKGKRFLITGANSGIGYQAALELARRGATVVLACRDQARGEAALDRLRVETSVSATTAEAAELVVLDLASFDSIQEVAEAELARNQPLHCLINNAGVMAPEKRLETTDGFELQFGTNVLGHFALTARLMPALSRYENSATRVVTIASIAHKYGQVNFDDLQATKKYSPIGAYQQSKLADLMFALEFDRRLRANGSAMISLAAHPGVANTNLFTKADKPGLIKHLKAAAMEVVGIVLNSDCQGALPTLYAATSPEVRGGGYYGPQGFGELSGTHVGPAKIAAHALDQSAQSHLWNVCENLTGLSLSPA